MLESDMEVSIAELEGYSLDTLVELSWTDACRVDHTDIVVEVKYLQAALSSLYKQVGKATMSIEERTEEINLKEQLSGLKEELVSKLHTSLEVPY